MSGINRDDLYERIWSKPMKNVAVEYGLSDVGLAKVCDRHIVPGELLASGLGERRSVPDAAGDARHPP